MAQNFSASPASTTSPSNVSQSATSGNGNISTNQTTPPSNFSPISGIAAPRLNPRSCISCRKRKVGCNKKHPCAHCSRAGTECIFPGPGRAPRRSRKPPDTEMLARLRRLEGLVQNFSKGTDDSGSVVGADLAVDPPKTAAQENEVKEEKIRNQNSCLGLHNANEYEGGSDVVTKEFGRLSIDGGRSRYVSNKFWVTLSEEVAEMRDILDDRTDDEDDYPLAGSGYTAAANHQAFMFGFRSTAVGLEEYHPAFVQVITYWDIFKQNIDPLIKIFHRPSIDDFIHKFDGRFELLCKTEEVMMFTIYFAVITSMSEDQCTAIFGVQRNPTLEKYRFAVEQALARAEFLSTQELIVLQSFTLFLTCVRRMDDSCYVWTLTGLMIRIAQSLGIHRDGKLFGLSPFETEMRRRLWWQICSLDVRASEDHGSDPTITEQSFDTKFPLNINDDDISPDMEIIPVEREGRTEMMFDQIRYTVSTTVRRLSYAPLGPGPCRKKEDSLTLEDKERTIEELHQYLENKYLKYCDMSNPLDWVSATMSRLIMAKMWLIVHHPLQRGDGGAGLPQGTQDRLFLTSIEVIEFSRLLQTEKSTMKWNWLFRTYVQWHAVAFVLSQLCKRTSGCMVQKAWVAIDSVFDEWAGTLDSSKKGMLWKPLRKLMARARLLRAEALERQSQFPLDGSLGPSGDSSSMPTAPETLHLVNGNASQNSFSPLPGMTQSSNSNTNQNLTSSEESMEWMNGNSSQYPSPYTLDTMQWMDGNAIQTPPPHAPETMQWINPTAPASQTMHLLNGHTNQSLNPHAREMMQGMSSHPTQPPTPPAHHPSNPVFTTPFNPSTNGQNFQSAAPFAPTDPQWNYNPTALMDPDESFMWFDNLVGKDGGLETGWY